MIKKEKEKKNFNNICNQYLKYKITFLKYILFIFFLEQKSISAKYESQNFCYSIYKIIKTVHFLSAKIYGSYILEFY